VITSLFALACLALVAIPMPVSAQGSDVGLSIGASPTTVTRGSTVAIFGLVTNNTNNKMRTTVTINSVAPSCGGGSTTSLGYTKLSLGPGESIHVSLVYPIPADACPGEYAITISADSGKTTGKTAAASVAAATTWVMVQE